jgi:hypothetical protein
VVKPEFFAAAWAIPGLRVDPSLPGAGSAFPGAVLGGSGPPLPPGATTPLPPVVAPTAQYWLFSQNQKWGPYAFAQLKLAFDSGQVARGTLAWRDGLPQWAPIETLAEFAATVAPGFPPMPPLPPGGGAG